MCIISGAAVQQKGYGWQKSLLGGGGSDSTVKFMYGVLIRLHFGEMLINNFSHSSCSNYDEQCPQFKVAPQESGGDNEEHEYDLLNPHTMAHVAS